jgi:hypothetical protein
MILEACTGVFRVPIGILRASCCPQRYVFGPLPSPRVFCLSCTLLSDLEVSAPPPREYITMAEGFSFAGVPIHLPRSDMPTLTVSHYPLRILDPKYRQNLNLGYVLAKTMI